MRLGPDTVCLRGGTEEQQSVIRLTGPMGSMLGTMGKIRPLDFATSSGKK